MRDVAYPWYTEVASTEALQQGDFITKCQIVQPKVEAYKENQEIEADVIEYDVIVMSQSCDLAARKIELVLVCPFLTLEELGKTYVHLNNPTERENIRKGYVTGYHLLSNPENHQADGGCLVVDFKSVYAIPFDFLERIVGEKGNRRRLLPPYREHLSQAFARFFMRVGLPSDIPQFK
jgi:hypothetical protein